MRQDEEKMTAIRTLSIDIETKSSVDLGKCGVYKYAQSPDFEILLFAVSVNGGPVYVYDLACGDVIPDDILTALPDNNVIKYAYNASFERICLSAYLRKNYPQYFRTYGEDGDATRNYLDPLSWRCDLVLAAYNGLPLSLESVGAVLGFEQQKMKEGKDLIRYFCVPCKPTKSNGGRTWNLPEHAPEKWELFKKYNKRDVEVEMQIQQRLQKYPVPDTVWQEYCIDQEINDRGIMMDRQMVEQAIKIDEVARTDIVGKMQDITGLDNPNSVVQLKGYLEDNGLEMESLSKKDVAAMQKDTEGEISDVLALRLQLAKSSVKKYEAMQNAVCEDGRCHGMFMFYGANRTGRWAGRMVQLQNLPQNHIEDLDDARELVKHGDYEILKERYGSVPGVLSELIRTAFIPRPGYKFIVSDFSAIEARVLAFLAGEQWRIDLFKNGGDIYCQSASQMFKVPVEKHGVNGHLRQKGKIAELACIAENELVLTNHGEKPIQDVTTEDLLWDGESWVQHEGVIFKGVREVITYDGLTATPDHLVFIKGQSRPIQFGIVAACGARLIQTGDGGNPVRLGDDYQFGEKMGQKLEANQRKARLYDIRNAGEHHRFTVSGKLVHNCGYGGAVGALKNMGALEMGLTEDELQPLVKMWREANPHITDYWWKVDNAIRIAISEKTFTYVGDIRFEYRNGMLFITLPSGRRLSYVKPRIETNKFGGESITYMGTDAQKKWSRLESYGPKFVENIVQGVSRDILANSMKAVNKLPKNYICGHVHDELIIECPMDMSLELVCKTMGQAPEWLEGIDLRADGYECHYYKKD